jgi:release factor glutamine methyltransferase
MTIEQAYHSLLNWLLPIYSESEAANISELVIENITGYYKSNRIINKNNIFNGKQEAKFNEITSELLTHKPIQYVLQEAWFNNKKYYVNENVLIPRSETEELIHLINADENNFATILDIGTGSGCIAISLKEKFPLSKVTGIDKSSKSLDVAKMNAKNFKTEIHFLEFDFLDETNWSKLNDFDLIVSNPPYVLQSERFEMNKNVLDFEPHTALFVPDNDALIFYRKIALFAKQHLKENGKIVVEINETFGEETKQLFNKNGYLTTIVKDMQQKNRFIIGSFI